MYVNLFDYISYMIYNKDYKVKFYQNSKDQSEPVLDYLQKINFKHRAKIYKSIDFLKDNGGYLDEPYGRHIKGKIRELRVIFSNNYYRVMYFCFKNKNIILLHIFLKRNNKTPDKEIKKATENYFDVINNPEIYED